MRTVLEPPSETVKSYIQIFYQRYHRLIKLNMTLPKPVLAFKLLKGANIMKEQRMLLLTGLDYNDKDKTKAKKSLKKYLQV